VVEDVAWQHSLLQKKMRIFQPSHLFDLFPYIHLCDNCCEPIDGGVTVLRREFCSKECADMWIEFERDVTKIDLDRATMRLKEVRHARLVAMTIENDSGRFKE
jgi:hypothetical protein